MLTILSLIDDIILKVHNEDLEGKHNDTYDVRENVMYMLSFEKFVEEDTAAGESE